MKNLRKFFIFPSKHESQNRIPKVENSKTRRKKLHFKGETIKRKFHENACQHLLTGK